MWHKMMHIMTIFGNNEILDLENLGQDGAIWAWPSKNSFSHPNAQQHIRFSCQRSC